MCEERIPHLSKLVILLGLIYNISLIPVEILSRLVLICHVRDWREGQRKGHLSWLLGLVLLIVNDEENIIFTA